MAAKRSDPRVRGDSPGELAAALGPHVDGLVAAAAQREAEAEARDRAELLRPRRLDEAELMPLIFAHLDDDNPRVCEGIDFDRLIIIDAVPEDPGPHSGTPSVPPHVEDGALRDRTGGGPVTACVGMSAEATGALRDRKGGGPASASVGGPPKPNGALRDRKGGGPATAPPGRGRPAEWPPEKLVASLASGRRWIDEVQAIDPELLDRPELDAEQRRLLERARGRLLPTVNLRRLEREPALAHLELFVQACRQQRARFVRAITGKGIESRAEPVLKRAVLHWCRERALGSAPELDGHGEWGALVIELGGRHA